ncbi:MAG TPA: hypothetical protein VLM11_21200 [Streptosporangiaceae bacterium]|nr:hypothetical protein [Streptosporangiaceae bacterium]
MNARTEILLYDDHDELVLDLPAPAEAVVPHRPHWPAPMPERRRGGTTTG